MNFFIDSCSDDIMLPGNSFLISIRLNSACGNYMYRIVLLSLLLNSFLPIQVRSCDISTTWIGDRNHLLLPTDDKYPPFSSLPFDLSPFNINNLPTSQFPNTSPAPKYNLQAHLQFPSPKSHPFLHLYFTSVTLLLKLMR